MHTKKYYFALAMAFVVAFIMPSTRAQAQGFVVIVNAADAATTLSKSEVSNIFLKKSSKLNPVDQTKNSSIREAFTKAVHGRPSAAIQSYWQQQIFSGKDVPPTEKSSDADVIAFVKATPGSIGYVSDKADLGAGVKAIAIP